MADLPPSRASDTTRLDATLAPGADGWLGSTGGITDDGHLVLGARVESQEAARRNSARPEQDAWWQATSPYLDDALFPDCPEVDVYKGGGSDDAGFVQVIQGRVTDKDAYRRRSRAWTARATLRSGHR